MSSDDCGSGETSPDETNGDNNDTKQNLDEGRSETVLKHGCEHYRRDCKVQV